MTDYEQESFWDYRPLRNVRGLTLQQRFELFHERNPWVYQALVRLTRDLVARGYGRVGMKQLYEVLRWQYRMRTADPTSDFRLNNDFTSRFARLIEHQNPDLARMNGGKGVYEKRELKAA